jgi:exopolyphosphatase/guanosine-5'-triphosphate,3'-diphosphate pyrophosphatase
MIGAAIDVGSNSVHLLVAVLAAGGSPARHMRVLRDESELLGLGARVDLEGHIGDDHGHATLEVVRAYVRAAREEEHAEWVSLLATEPLRRASDRSAFCQAVEAAVGLPLHVLSHDEEALLTVLAVLGGEAVREATLVLDIGGGSSEVVLLDPGADPVLGVLPVGSARLTAAFVEDDPPTAGEVEAMRAEADHLMAGMPVGRPKRGIVTGGSGTNMLQLVARVGGQVPDGRATIDRGLARHATSIVMSRPAAELVEVTGLRERRILQMAAGASLIEAALDCYRLDRLEASDASLREGAIMARARVGEDWLRGLARLITGA